MHLLKYLSFILCLIPLLAHTSSEKDIPKLLSYEASLDLGLPAQISTGNSKFIKISGTFHTKVKDTVIPKGMTWVISEGASIIVPNNGSITVEGNIQARGSKSNPIVFKTTGKSWKGITFKGNLEGDLSLGDEIGSSFKRDFFDINLLSNTKISNILTGHSAITLVSSPLLAYNIKSSNLNLIRSKSSLFYLLESNIGCSDSILLDVEDSRALLINSEIGLGAKQCKGEAIKATNSNIGFISSKLDNFITGINTYSSKLVVYNSSIGARWNALLLNTTFFAVINSNIGAVNTPIDFRPTSAGIISNSKLIYPNKGRCPIKSSTNLDLYVDNLSGWNGCLDRRYVFDFNEYNLSSDEKIETNRVKKWITKLPYLSYPKWRKINKNRSDEDYANTILEEVTRLGKIGDIERQIQKQGFNIIPKNELVKVCLKQNKKSYYFEDYTSTLKTSPVSRNLYVERDCRYNPIIPNNTPSIMVNKAKELLQSFGIKK